MTICLLGPGTQKLRPGIGDRTIRFDRPIVLGDLEKAGASCVVSFGYRHLITSEVLGGFGGPILNLHSSFLPWNRGAHPNFWSWLENTPQGVTVHVVDRGLDTGPIVSQKRLLIDPSHTLSSSYLLLESELISLFFEIWPQIRDGNFSTFGSGEPAGTFHRKADLELHRAALPDGFETKCQDVREYGRRRGLWRG